MEPLKVTSSGRSSQDDIEIIWVSLRRKGLPPVMIGTYYGKQESRSSKTEIEREMTKLTEEIHEMKRFCERR